MTKNHTRFFLGLAARQPACWTAILSAAVMMTMNITIPVYFRLLLDLVIPVRVEGLFWWCIGGALVSVTIFGAQRAALKFQQASARDGLELSLHRLRLERVLDAAESRDWERVDRLQGLPRDDLRRIAELLGIEPGQAVAGAFYLAAIMIALAAAGGLPTCLVALLVLGLRLLDFVLASREAKFIRDRSAAFGEMQAAENALFASARSLATLGLRQLAWPRLSGCLGALDGRRRTLRTVQLHHDALTMATAEWLYAGSFLVAGYQAFMRQISFGVFVFVVTLLLQVQQPLYILLEAVLNWRRLQPMLAEVGAMLTAGAAPAAGRPAAPIALPARVALTGPSGSGKTTFAEACVDAWTLDGDKRGEVAYVPQSPVMFPVAAKDYVAHLAGAAATVRRLGIEELLAAERPADCLSGGEKRRLLIARALLRAPAVLVLDEPEAGLDRDSRDGVRRLLAEELLARPELSLVIVSHDPDFTALLPHSLAMTAAERRGA